MQIREHASTKPAIIMHPTGTVVTFAELEARANRLAHHFRRAGLREGDTVAAILENNEHVHAVMWAARRCGLYYTLINTHLTGAEAAYIIENSGAKAVIGSRATRGICEQLTDLPELLMIADGAGGSATSAYGAGGSATSAYGAGGSATSAYGAGGSATSASSHLDGWQRYPDCVGHEPATPIDDELEGDLLQYSSGTTGRPKGIRRPLPHKSPAEAPNVLSALLMAIGMTSDAVYLNPAPLYHTAPCLWSMSALAMGATVVVMEKFDPREALEAIQRHRVTHGQFVPAMFVRMLKLPEVVRNSYDVSSLRRVVHAAAPCPVEIKQQMIDWWGPIVDEYYSSSEGAGITFITANDWTKHPGSVGKPLLGEAHILDENGEDVPTGQPGQIYFDVGTVAFEYHRDPEKTAASRDKHGWVTVGDIGYLDDEGYLFLTDRRHHMIISGGVNIYPQEAENLLVTHPKVLDAAVFGIPDDEMGQSVKGVVQTVDPSDATDEFADELLAWLRDRLAHYKCPRSISFEAQLPRTDTGKLYKQELVRKYSSEEA